MAAGGLLWKVAGTGSAIVTAVAVRKIMTTAWKTTTGNPPPANPESPDVTWREALAWAVLSGAAVGVGRMLATRKVAHYWRRSTGHLPPGMEKVVA
jgi:Protein of unknown function (DUF4235)